jgi:hypothetical protein
LAILNWQLIHPMDLCELAKGIIAVKVDDDGVGEEQQKQEQLAEEGEDGLGHGLDNEVCLP